MAGRLGWSALKTVTRNRYQKAGITEADYNAGASLKAGRGHRNTPEHPSDFLKNPEKYKGYGRRQAIRVRSTTPITALVKDGLHSRLVTFNNLSKSERKIIGSHANYVSNFAYGTGMNSPEDEAYLRKSFNKRRAIKSHKFQGDDGKIYELETRPIALTQAAFAGIIDRESPYDDNEQSAAA